VDEILSFEQEGSTYYPLADALGSIHSITDAAGVVVRSSSYDAYGATTSDQGTGSGIAFGYTGREHDEETGVLYYRARYLSPVHGRFLSPDPLAQLAGPNYYLYAGGNPAQHRDPTGFYPRSTVDAYAMAHPASFIALMIDLGVISRSVLTVVGTIGGTATIAYPISQMISASRDDPTEGTGTCTTTLPRTQGIYYRGLSRDDVRDFSIFGVVPSKYVREMGASFIDALAHFVTGARNHSWSSDDIGGGIPSPFVSTSLNLATARAFANNSISPGRVVLKLTTSRPGLPTIDGFGEAEVLFFFMIGMPGERLEVEP
jgi:RHS repeat-associated protein